MLLAVGTLTVLRVSPPSAVDRRVGSWAMTLAPLVGMLLAVAAAPFLWLLSAAAPPTLAAALTLALLAVLTRAMHLDGLADTADGLGSGRPADQALAVMRRSDIGPFGVVTLVLVLLVQALALGALTGAGNGPVAVAVALVASRLVLAVVCLRGIPAARPEGLGQVVAGSVSWGHLLLASVTAAVGLALLTVAAAPSDLGRFLAAVAAAVLGAVAAAGGLCLRCVRRLGGVTGDVLGGCVEVAFTAALLVLNLLA
jgi:adenosylcobinamide-GDP ribazoletransferase